MSFCFQIVLWGSFDRFLSIFFKKIKILEKIMIFVYQHGAWVLVVSAKSIKDYQKSSFFMIHLIFYDQHRSSQTLLFYSKHKVWIFPEILSPFAALYDKNSLLWLFANFSKKWDFGRISCIWMNLENLISSESLRGATEASFCRMELLRCSFFQKLSILCV